MKGAEMTDIAYLGLGIKTDPVNEATEALGKFAAAAGAAENAGDKLAKQTEKTGKSMDSLVGYMTKVASAAGIAFSVKGVVDMSDAWSDLTSRVNLAAGSVEKGSAVMKRLDDVAKRTYSSITNTTESYIANATSLRDLGYSTNQTLDYTEALNNALVVSGAKGQQAASVTMALSKAMALGKLSGENLNTVVASGGRVAEALAQQLGVTTNELINLGAKGKITGDVIYKSLTGQLVTLREEAESMPATIGDAFTRIGSNLLIFIGSMDQLGNTSGWVAETLIVLADNIDRVVSYGIAAATVYGVGLAGAFVIATVKAGLLSAALRLLKTALISSGVGLIVVALGEFIALLISARKATDSWGDAFSLVSQRLLMLWEGLKTGWDSLILYLKSKWFNFLASVYQSTDKMVTGLMRLFGISADDAEAIGATYGLMGETAGKYALDGFETASKQIKEALKGFEVPDAGDVNLDGDGRVGGGAGGGDGKKKKKKKGEKSASEKWQETVKSIQDQTAALKDQAEAFGMTNFQADLYTKTQELMRAAKEAGIPITEGVTAQIQQLATDYADAQLKLQGLQLEMENRTPWETMAEEISNLKEMVDRGAISWDTYTASVIKSRARAHGEIAGMAKDATGLLGQLFENNKAVAIADAIISTYQGVAKTLATYPMPFAGIMAAGHLALGMKQVMAIKSTNKNSSSVSGASVSSGAGASTPSIPQEENSSAVNVTIKGDTVSKQSVVELFEEINQHIKDGGRIITVN